MKFHHVIAIVAAIALLAGGVLFYRSYANSRNTSDNATGQGVKTQTTFENDKVKIDLYHFNAHAKIPARSLPDSVIVWRNAGQLKLTSSDGTSKQISVKAGQVEYEAAQKSASENL